MGKLTAAWRLNLSNLLNFSGRQGLGTYWRYTIPAVFLCIALQMIALIPMQRRMFSGMMAQMRGIGQGHPRIEDMEAFHRSLAPDIRFSIMAGVVCHAVLVALLLAATTRRLHDCGRGGWWCLLVLAPLGGQMAMAPRVADIILASGGNFDPVLWVLVMVNGLLFYAGLGLLIFFLVQRSNPGANRYGPPPPESAGS